MPPKKFSGTWRLICTQCETLVDITAEVHIDWFVKAHGERKVGGSHWDPAGGKQGEIGVTRCYNVSDSARGLSEVG